MNKKVTKKTKRRLFMITLITCFVVVFFLTNTFTIYIQIIGTNQKEKKLADQLYNLKDKEDYLKTEVEKLSDPDYVAKYAREKYLYSREGEFTIKMP